LTKCYVLAVIRLELCGVAVIFWTKLHIDDKEPHKCDFNELKGGDLIKEEYMEKVVFLEKGSGI